MDSHKNHSTEATNGELELAADHNACQFREHNGISSPSVQQETVEPRKHWIKKTQSSSPSASATTRQHFHVRLIRKLNLASVRSACKEWLKHPAHIALLVWSICVVVSATMLVLLLLGVLDEAFPRKSLRNRWMEINNQILNALFTLMSIYQHPNLFHHFVLLCRWRLEDGKELRRVYCKNGTSQPHDRFHMAVVVVLLHITCFSQYVMCSLYWLYSRKTRPEVAETFFAVLGTAAPILAGLYTYYSPLGKKCEPSLDEEPDAGVQRSNEVTVEVNVHRVEVTAPEWAGGVFDCGDDTSVCCLSFFCTFCVFGWNMERLGFGNMYVHMVMFVLLCFAPLWIFNIAAFNIREKVIGDVVGTAGIVLCAFGLLYGGFWRMQMRKKYRLPGNNQCYGSASLTDYFQWMFCWPCSLAQEVRTGNLYDIEDGSIYPKNSTFLQPLPRESSLKSATQSGSHSAIPVHQSVQLPNLSTHREDQSLLLQEQACLSPGEAMKPPIPPSIRAEDHELNDKKSSSQLP